MMAVAAVMAVIATGIIGPRATADAQGAAPPRPVSWMAAGDSYSSGEGTTGTTAPCQRSTKAWSLVAWRDNLSTDDYAEPEHVACTGAKLEHLRRSTQVGMAGLTQVEEAHRQHGGRFDLVTFSFGGNDIGFEEVLVDCMGLDWRDSRSWGAALLAGQPLASGAAHRLSAGCNVSEDELRSRIDNVAEALADELVELADQDVTPGGQVIVAGYPNLFEDPGRWPVWRRVADWCSGIKASDVSFLRGIAGSFNQQLKAVTEAADHDSVSFSFVDVNGEVFETSDGNHGLCSDDPWLNDLIDGVAARRYQRAFHPNDAGHAAMGEHVADTISGLDWTELEPDPAWSPLPTDTCTWVREYVDLPQPFALVNGEVPGFPENLGGVGIENRPIVYADLDGDGASDAIVTIYCTAGGSGYTHELVAHLTSRSSSLRVPLGEGVDPPWEFIISQMDIEDQAIVVSFVSGEGDEALCCGSRLITDRLRLLDREFQRVDRSIVDAASFGQSILGAANNSDFESLASVATTEAIQSLREIAGRGMIEGCEGSFQVEDRRECFFREADGFTHSLVLEYVDLGEWRLLSVDGIGGGL